MKRQEPYGTDSGTSSVAAFTGEGATQKLDNERVAVWEYVQAPAARPHRHTRDAVVVAIEGQNPRAVWVKQGTVHNDEGTGQASRVYVFEIK
jgi:hypothetical protein